MLFELIKTHAATEAAAGDWSGVVAKLTAATIVQRDESPLTYARVRTLFGEPARQLVAATIRGAALTYSHADPLTQAAIRGDLADAHVVLLNESTGLRIDLDDRQSLIDELAVAGSWSDALRDGMKALGKRIVAPWQDAGLSAAPDAAAVQTAWQAGELEADFATQMNDVVWPSVSAGRAALVAALQTAAANLGA